MVSNRWAAPLAVLLISTLILAGCSIFEDPDGGKCRDLMSAKLTSPGSAKFGPVKVEMTGNGTKLVTGWVDAENGFGALLRQDYYCESSNGEVTLTYP
jgi:hypothetical protein